MDPFSSVEQIQAKSDLSLTPEHKRLQKFSKLMVFMHLGIAVAIPLIGNLLLSWGDWAGRKLFDMPRTDIGTSHFWMVSSIALAFTIVFCAYRVWRDPVKNLPWMLPIIQTKIVMAGCFAIFYFLDLTSLPYIIAFAVEFVLFLASLILWRMAAKSNQDLAFKPGD